MTIENLLNLIEDTTHTESTAPTKPSIKDAGWEHLRSRVDNWWLEPPAFLTHGEGYLHDTVTSPGEGYLHDMMAWPQKKKKSLAQIITCVNCFPQFRNLSYLDLFYFIMCLSVLPASTYMHHLCARFQQRSEEGVGFSGTGAKDGCEPPWVLGLKLGPLQECS